jgi:hypothetical protein
VWEVKTVCVRELLYVNNEMVGHFTNRSQESEFRSQKKYKGIFQPPDFRLLTTDSCL